MRKGSIVLFLTVAGLALTACNRQTGQTPEAPATGAPIASLPLAQGAPPPMIVAPALTDLPATQPVRNVSAPPRERYRYIDRAQTLGDAFADSPPDYTVDYQGVRPWVWRSGHGEYRVVEPTPEGERTYYFDAGSDEPFLVRDADYAYGYDQGGLAAIYGPGGRSVGYDADAAERAARYLARARALYQAAVHQQREAAYAEAWRERRERVLAEQQAWDAEQQRDSEWRDWHDSQQRTEPPDWDRERAMRTAYAAQTAALINAQPSEGRHGPPPIVQTNGHPPSPSAQPGGPGPSQEQRVEHPPQPQIQAQQQLQAQQHADAARAAQAESLRQAQVQAQQQKAQADRDALRAARSQTNAAAQAQAMAQSQQAHQHQAQAQQDAQRAALQQARAAKQVQEAQQSQAAQQAKAAAQSQAQAQAQAQQAQQHQAQAQQEAERAARQQARAAKQAQDAQQSQVQQQAKAAAQSQAQAQAKAQQAQQHQAQAQQAQAAQQAAKQQADAEKAARHAAKQSQTPSQPADSSAPAASQQGHGHGKKDKPDQK